MRPAFILASVLFVLGQMVQADVVVTTSGREIHCLVLQESDHSVTLKLEHGTITYPRANVQSIRREAVPVAVTTQRATQQQRLIGWEPVIRSLATMPWAGGLRQIPATVIDNGVMRNVPYQSYRCGNGDYELNIYGDPDTPAAIEIGVYRSLLTDNEAKEKCIAFIASLMTTPADAEAVRTIDRHKALIERAGLKVEVTPPTDEDAYGGWWVSVYDLSALEKARASDDEMRVITVSKQEAAAAVPATAEAATEPVKQAGTLKSSAPTFDIDGWNSSDMGYARSSTSTSSGYSGGTVYVRGYYRRDGTYVHSYTRSSPGSGHRSGRRR